MGQERRITVSKMNYSLHYTSIPSLLFPVRSVSLHSLKIMNKFHFLRSLLQNQCPWKFSNIQRKPTVLESLFNKAVGQTGWHFIKRRPQRRVFSVKFVNFSGTPFFHKTPPVDASVIFKQMTLYSAIRNLF